MWLVIAGGVLSWCFQAAQFGKCRKHYQRPTLQHSCHLRVLSRLPQRRFQIKLTLSAPENLKVRKGDTVITGQILADRVRDRTRLEFQQGELTQQLIRLKAQMALPVPEVNGLPTASLLGEVADVARFKLKAKDVQRAKEQQQRKLDLLQSLPQHEVPEADHSP